MATSRRAAHLRKLKDVVRRSARLHAAWRQFPGVCSERYTEVQDSEIERPGGRIVEFCRIFRKLDTLKEQKNKRGTDKIDNMK